MTGLYIGRDGTVELFEETSDWSDQADDEEIDSNDERSDNIFSRYSRL